ncbi:YqcC family protein [Pseudomonas lalucatii]|uniref:YqcC family protein n=1 Tax=Pseudomonas lalucatii TaxID=1424203 RepID=A0ABS5Q0B6_9PSED|nr:YqcC family protein [Pseudomonas lalucatii]MBS7661955.1 YqcC family protein [Pseudomonas lalucatii]MBS7726192.1 YqcC family protein [Pseudomonas lalucatii]QVM88240.1 YqcC family protein [Pseudomonas lalucatii]
MEARVSAIAEQLLLIERELRVQGWWSEQPPSAQALASQQPFCVDSMAFEQWLQWIFLPRMKQMLEAGAQLPSVSGIRPMAEQVYSDRAAQAGELICLLGEFDRLIGGAD